MKSTTLINFEFLPRIWNKIATERPSLKQVPVEWHGGRYVFFTLFPVVDARYHRHVMPRRVHILVARLDAVTV